MTEQVEKAVILVTGATGHLGNVLVRRLLENGEQVRALILPGESCESLQGLDVECVEGNVLDAASLERAMQGAEIVYHLAGIISILPGAEEIMRKVNVEGTHNAANAALISGVRRFVHVSSIHAYERVPHGVAIDETLSFAPDNPAGAYDRTKAQGTLAVLNAVERGLDAVIVCPTGVVGPYDYSRSEIGQVIKGYSEKRLHFLVDGAFDFVDVRDVAEGLIKAGEKGRTGEAYILSGTHIDISKISRLVQEIVCIKSTEIMVPMRMAKFAAKFLQPFYKITKRVPMFTTYSLQTVCENAVINYSKACEELGYNPRPIRETIADTVVWWREWMGKSRKAGSSIRN